MASKNIRALTTNRRVDSTFHRTQAADFWIKVEDETIAVHKDLLISAAPYFGCLFESGMQEVQNQTMTIDCYRPNIVTTVIKYIYGENTQFEWEDLAEYLDIVECWQMLELKVQLDDYISRNIYRDTGNYWFAMARRYMLSKVTLYLCSNVPSVTSWPDFLQLDRPQLLELLSDDVLRDMSCEAKLHVCISWVVGDETTRKCHYMDLLGHIGLKCCSEKFIQVVVEVYKNKRIVGGDIVRRYIDPLLTLVNRDAGDKGQSVIVVCDKHSPKYDSPQITTAVKLNVNDVSAEELHSFPCDFNGLKLRCWTPYGLFGLPNVSDRAVLLHVPSMSHVHLPCVRSYTSWGPLYSGDVIYVLNVLSMYSLNLRTLQRSKCAYPPCGSVSVVCAVRSRLFIITVQKEFYVYDTEVYKIWKYLGGCPVKTCRGSCGVAVGADMYILNGRNWQCAKYNTNTKQWTRIKRHNDRYRSCAAIYSSGKIILFGSLAPAGNDPHPETTHVELYDIEQDQWETTSLTFPWRSSNICMGPI